MHQFRFISHQQLFTSTQNSLLLEIINLLQQGKSSLILNHLSNWDLSVLLFVSLCIYYLFFFLPKILIKEVMLVQNEGQ